MLKCHIAIDADKRSGAPGGRARNQPDCDDVFSYYISGFYFLSYASLIL